MSDLEVVSTGIRDLEPTAHEKYAAALRDLARFYEHHPEIQLPSETRLYLFVEKVEDVATYAKAFGYAKKAYLGDSYFTLNREFGSRVVLQATWNRDQVCERVVVGQEEVEEEVVVSQTKELRKVTREKVEWRCPKVLEPKELGDGA